MHMFSPLQACKVWLLSILSALPWHIVVTEAQRQMRRVRCPWHHCVVACRAQRKSNEFRWSSCDGANRKISKSLPAIIILRKVIEQFERTRIGSYPLLVIFEIKRFAFWTHELLIPFIFTSRGAEDKNGTVLGCFRVKRTDGVADFSFLHTIPVWRLLQHLFTFCAFENICCL